MFSKPDVRSTQYAGSWYSGDPEKLKQQLTDWLRTAEEQEVDSGERGEIRAIIGPHAGYVYGGSTAAFAYRGLMKMRSQVKCVFLFGPSHRKSFRGCMLPSASMKAYGTPWGPLPLNLPLIAHLESSFPDCFGRLSKATELHEHSLEMHLPFIYHCIMNHDTSHVTLIPIMVGSLPSSLSSKYGQIFAPYFDDQNNFFVISSDFCHWGKSFEYTFYRIEDGPEVYKSIEALDRRSFKAIESLSDADFRKYLDQTQNTICGRHPISILLSTLRYTNAKCKIEFIQYQQSKKCMSKEDTSVSYAAALVKSLTS